MNSTILETNLPAGKSTVGAVGRSISIRRRHGLGNVICLLPALDYLHRLGCEVQVITHPKWTFAFSQLRPDYDWISDTGDSVQEIIDLDEMTKRKRPTEHRVEEFAHLLHITEFLPSPQLSVPQCWSEPFEHLRGGIIFAPEGGHPSRSWPMEKAAQVKAALPYPKLILVGTKPEPALPCDLDTRGQLKLHELLGLLAVADVVITMDSGVLHIATALGIPTVAIFGGMNPHFRVRPEQRVVVLQTNLLCCPCSKKETCFDRFDCIKAAAPQDISKAVRLVGETDQCVIQKIPPLFAGMFNPLLPGIHLPHGWQ